MPSYSKYLALIVLAACLEQVRAQGTSQEAPLPQGSRLHDAVWGPRAAERFQRDPRGVSDPGPEAPAATESPEPPAAAASEGGNAPIPLSPSNAPPRTGPPGTRTPPGGWRTVVTVGSSLAVVLGLFLVAAWVMRRGTPGAIPLLPGEVLEVLGRAPLAGRQQLHLIRLGARLVLVCVTPAGVETISEVTQSEEVQQLTALCRQARPSSATAAFRHVLERFSAKPDHAESWLYREVSTSAGAGERSPRTQGLREERRG